MMLRELVKLSDSWTFDKRRANEIIQCIDVNQVFVSSRFPKTPYNSTFLNEAIMSNNVAMVELLLKAGANPNLVFDSFGDECVLWGLQFTGDYEYPNENERRLMITQLLLDYGANPNIVLDAEQLFSYVTFGIFNDDFVDEEDWQYRSRFYILLIAYGGKDEHYCIPRVVGAFDKENIHQYKFYLVPEGDNQFSGIIKDGKGTIVAYV